MWIQQPDAQTDFALATATYLFFDDVLSLVARIPGYPSSGVAGAVLFTVWAFVATAMVPILLARMRGHGLAAFGLDGPRAVSTGLALAVPFTLASIVVGLGTTGSTLTSSMLGRLSGIVAPDSVAGAITTFGGAFVRPVGLFLLLAFLTTRAKETFRQPDVTLTEGIRTFGMGAAAAMGLFGLLSSFRLTFLRAVLPAVAMVAVVLLVDRLVDKTPVNRAAVLAPGIVLSFQILLSTIFSGADPLVAFLFASFLFGLGVTTAVLVASKQHAWAALGLILSIGIWPPFN